MINADVCIKIQWTIVNEKKSLNSSTCTFEITYAYIKKSNWWFSNYIR